jgi:hypothetical protein
VPREIDVDAILAEAEEETRETPQAGVLRFRAQEFVIQSKPRHHLALAEAFAGGNQAVILGELFGSEYDRLRELDPDVAACNQLIIAASRLMAGLDPGESSGSEDSSASTSEPSEQTSDASTTG